MIRRFFGTLAVLELLLLVQTTLFGQLAFAGFKPDLLWVVFVLLATQNGAWLSQFIGFLLGISVDLVTLAPLGYHGFLFTLAGYLFGLGKGKVFFDPIVMPVFFAALVTVYQAGVGFLLSAVFNLGSSIQNVFSIGLFFQLILNLALAPAVYWVYNWIRNRFQDPRRGFGE